MTRRTTHAPRRRGSYITETALVLTVVIFFLFGIFEFGRLLLMSNALQNAAREGGRLAVSHTNDMTTQEIKDAIGQRLAGLDTRLENYQVSLSGIILRADADPTRLPGQTFADWTAAKSTDGIVVELTADYKPILPSLLMINSTLPLRAKCVMYSEAN